jgi:signal transduction histidine kinase
MRDDGVQATTLLRRERLRSAQKSRWPNRTRELEVQSTVLHEEDVAQIVHDLKHPLATIALETELLDARIHHEALGPAVQRILRNIGFLDRLVHDLLDLCAIDTSHLEIERSSTELRALVERVVERTIASRDRGRVTIIAPQAVTLPLDPLRIERVLANLLQNALKYAPGTPIVVQIDVLPELARVAVVDRGPGITLADQAIVFEKYHRAETARAKDGTGLGLYVSKCIVEAHGGRIDVESIVGQGCRFFFELPRH